MCCTEHDNAKCNEKEMEEKLHSALTTATSLCIFDDRLNVYLVYDKKDNPHMWIIHSE